MTMMSVPVIDIASAFSEDPAAKAAVADEVDRACRDIGSFVITGHGVPGSLIDRVYAASRDFFDLPISEKMKCQRPAPFQIGGYVRVVSEASQYGPGVDSSPVLNESLSIGPIEVDRANPDYSCSKVARLFAPNVWPGSLPGLRDAWTEWFRTMEALARDLMRLFALALDLPERFFDDKIDRDISVLRVLNYPSQGDAPLPHEYRLGAHSDYGSLSIARIEDRPGGLEVCNKAGEWVAVPCVPDSFVVNIADLMAQWTNDRWISAMHRVVNPPRGKALDSRRISLVFFHHPNDDTVVECLPGCVAPCGSPNHAPITSGDHLLSIVRPPDYV